MTKKVFCKKSKTWGSCLHPECNGLEEPKYPHKAPLIIDYGVIKRFTKHELVEKIQFLETKLAKCKEEKLKLEEYQIQQDELLSLADRRIYNLEAENERQKIQLQYVCGALIDHGTVTVPELDEGDLDRWGKAINQITDECKQYDQRRRESIAKYEELRLKWQNLREGIKKVLNEYAGFAVSYRHLSGWIDELWLLLKETE